MGAKIIVNFLVCNVPRCLVSNAKTFGMKHLQFPNMEASGGPSDGARVVHHGTDELLVQQNTIPDEETSCLIEVPALPVSEPLFFSPDR